MSDRRHRDDEDERERRDRKYADRSLPAWATTLLVVGAGVTGIWWGTESVKDDVPKLQADVRVLDHRVDRQAGRLNTVVKRLGLKVAGLREDTDDIEDDVSVVQDSLEDLLSLFNEEARE